MLSISQCDKIPFFNQEARNMGSGATKQPQKKNEKRQYQVNRLVMANPVNQEPGWDQGGLGVNQASLERRVKKN